MSEHVSLAVGTTVSISPTLPSTYDVAGYRALTYTPIKGVRDAGDIAEQHVTITRAPIHLNYSYQERVGRVLPSLSWEILRLKNNSGQQVLLDAFLGDAQAFQIEHADGTQLYFSATVKGRTRVIKEGSTLLAYRIELDVQREVIEV